MSLSVAELHVIYIYLRHSGPLTGMHWIHWMELVASSMSVLIGIISHNFSDLFFTWHLIILWYRMFYYITFSHTIFTFLRWLIDHKCQTGYIHSNQQVKLSDAFNTFPIGNYISIFMWRSNQSVWSFDICTIEVSFPWDLREIVNVCKPEENKRTIRIP